MQFIKRTIALVLAGSLLLLAGCNGEGKDTASKTEVAEKGRFVENALTLPIQGNMFSSISSEGNITLYDDALKTKYDSTDLGQTWNESKGPGAANEAPLKPQKVAIFPDGRVVVFSPESGLAVLSADGTSSKIPGTEDIDKAIENKDIVMLSMLEVVGENSIFLNYSILPKEYMDAVQNFMGGESGSSADSSADAGAAVSGETNETTANQSGDGDKKSDMDLMNAPPEQVAQILDITTGKTLVSFASTSTPMQSFVDVTGVTADDTYAYTLGSDGNITTYALADGKRTDRPLISVKTQSTTPQSNVVSMPTDNQIMKTGDNSFLVSYDNTLLSVGADETIKTILDKELYSIGTSRTSITNMAMLTDGSILLSLVDAMDHTNIYHYVFDENASTATDKVLTVWSLDENKLIRSAITEFRKKMPNVMVQYDVARPEAGALSADDAIKSLNTRLLGGDAPDVMILDGCPIESYQKQGVLLPLDGLFDTSDVYESLVRAAKSPADGKTYAFPTQFYLPFLTGSKSNLTSLTTLDALLEVIESSPIPNRSENPDDMFTQIPEAERGAVSFNTLDELFEIMWISSAPSVISQDTLNEDGLKNYLTALKKISDKCQLATNEQESFTVIEDGALFTIPGSLMSYFMQKTNHAAFPLSDLQLISQAAFVPDSDAALFPGLTKGAFKPSVLTGISVDTKQQDIAAAFAQTMLSQEVQQFGYGAGLSVTKQGMESKIALINKQFQESPLAGTIPTFEFDAEKYTAQLESPAQVDALIEEIVRANAKDYCKGTIDLEKAVQQISQNVKNRLVERK